MKNSFPKTLSFVVIGKNAEWSIARLLDSILASTPPLVTSEIIYVDSASTDRTIEIVSRYPVGIVQLSPDQPLCASAGRFLGLQHACGEFVVFLDSDMELLDGWLGPAMATLKRQRDIGVISGVILDLDRASGSRLANDEPLPVGGEPTEIKFAGNAAMFRRAALEAAGTWNPYIISDEEPELCLRIRHAGYRVIQLDLPISRHYTYPVNRISTLLSRRKRRLFLGFGQVIRYHLHTGLLMPYLRERGWVVFPALIGLAALGFVLVSCISGNAFWFLGFLGVIGLAVAMDAVRSRSLYKAIFHVFHRALILEGTARGFFLHPHDPGEYPRDERVFDAAADRASDTMVSA